MSSGCATILEKIKALETRKKSLQIRLQTTSNKPAIIEQIESINEQINQIKSDNPHCFYCSDGMLWTNYPSTQSLTPYSTCRPNSLADVAAIIREAEAAHKHVHAFGSK